MPFLASIEGQIVFLVIAGIIGLINWLTKKGEADQPQAPTPPRMPRAPKAGADDEAERMRKFLEALGLPADQAPKPTARPAPTVAKAAPPPLPPPRAVPARRSRPPRSLDEAPAPTLPVEQLHVAELQTAALPEFHTHSSEVSAIPMERAGVAAVDPYANVQRIAPVESIRRGLRSRDEVRAAMILREVLGPPRGLQS